MLLNERNSGLLATRYKLTDGFFVHTTLCLLLLSGDEVAQEVERLNPGSVSVRIMGSAETEVMVSPLYVCVAAR